MDTFMPLEQDGCMACGQEKDHLGTKCFTWEKPYFWTFFLIIFKYSNQSYEYTNNTDGF